MMCRAATGLGTDTLAVTWTSSYPGTPSGSNVQFRERGRVYVVKYIAKKARRRYNTELILHVFTIYIHLSTNTASKTRESDPMPGGSNRSGIKKREYGETTEEDKQGEKGNHTITKNQQA